MEEHVAWHIDKDRMMHIFAMAKKKADAMAQRIPGGHFRAYPPAEFLADSNLIHRPEVFTALRHTVWWIRWHDEQYDPLSFIEFLAFVDQLLNMYAASEAAMNKVQIAQRRESKHAG